MNSLMMLIKIRSLFEHQLWRFKNFNGCGEKVESFLRLIKKKKGRKEERRKLFLDPWLHRNVLFDSKFELPLVIFLGQNAYVLKRSKSGIEFRKRFMIRSWNEGDMTIWSKAAQRVCCYRIAYGSNSFCLFRLFFWATCWAWKLLNCGSHTEGSFGKSWC